MRHARGLGSMLAAAVITAVLMTVSVAQPPERPDGPPDRGGPGGQGGPRETRGGPGGSGGPPGPAAVQTPHLDTWCNNTVGLWEWRGSV